MEGVLPSDPRRAALPARGSRMPRGPPALSWGDIA